MKGVQFLHSTNGAEGNNSALNNKIGCLKTLNETLEAIKEFKSEQLTRYYEEVVLGKYQKTRSTTAWRHERVHQTVQQFSRFNIVQKVTELHETSIYLGYLITFVKNRN